MDQRVLKGPHELSQRTNQLNVSGRRYQRDEIEALQAPASTNSAYVFQCRDRFGDYGMIAMCVIDVSAGHIESFMMSCRVQRKRVEQAIFAWLAYKCEAAKVEQISAAYRKTKRNEASMRMFEELGFAFVATGSEEGRFIRSTGAPIAESDVVAVRDVTEVRAKHAG